MTKGSSNTPAPPAATTSVVLGTYNGARFILEQLESLAFQSCLPLELLVSDDGSSDETLDIVRAFADRAPFPVLVHQNPTNLGFGENFLQAALRARGKYVAFCDQDDVWTPNKLELCEPALTNTGVVLVAHTARTIDEHGSQSGLFLQNIRRNRVRPPLDHDPWGVYFGFSMVFRRELLDVIPPSRRGIDYITGGRPLAHDRWILFLANLVGRTAEIQEPLAGYRQHGANQFGSAEARLARNWRSAALGTSNRYLLAAREQRALVETAANSPGISETEFDHQRAARFWDKAIFQLKARNRVYAARNTLLGAAWIALNLISGAYLTIPHRHFRLRSVMKDLAFLFGTGMKSQRPPAPSGAAGD
jgi:glycosyltransferase involved in cell wall biosynthesis